MPILTETDLLGSDVAFLLGENERKPTRAPEKKVSEWIENRRILPPNTPFPGLWENARTPYLVEIMDDMSPSSPVTDGALMKGIQVGATAAAENIVAYWIGESPADILFMSATEKLLQRWQETRLEPLIDSCGIRERILDHIGGAKSRATGDKAMSKIFVGGSLYMSTARQASLMRATERRVLIRDEIDGAPPELSTGEGNWLQVSYARTVSFEHRKKVFDFSTPTTMEASLIYQQYLKGDQRHFMVPCPHCGKRQFLEWGSERGSHGMRADRTAGQLVNAYYICDYCHEAFFNHHKALMLPQGRWEPSAMAITKERRSRWLPSLYAPPGMISWKTIYEKYDEAQNDPEGMRSFVTLYMGLPYKETGSRPSLDKVIALRGGYKSGDVPDGVLWLTAAIDVQRGSETDETKPARLEMEILGHGSGFRTWSIMYHVFVGEIDDPYGGAWAKLTEFVEGGEMTFTRSDGREFSVMVILVDSGEGKATNVVYNFTSFWDGTFPCKGFGKLTDQQKEKTDQLTRDNLRRYRMAKVGADITLVEISTNYYKRHLYNNLKIPRQELGLQKPGFCDFPRDYGEKYFKMLTAAEMRRDGSFYTPSGRAEEALDCRVYNLAGGDIYLDSLVSDARASAKQQGFTQMQIQEINHRTVLQKLDADNKRIIGGQKNTPQQTK